MKEIPITAETLEVMLRITRIKAPAMRQALHDHFVLGEPYSVAGSKYGLAKQQVYPNVKKILDEVKPAFDEYVRLTANSCEEEPVEKVEKTIYEYTSETGKRLYIVEKKSGAFPFELTCGFNERGTYQYPELPRSYKSLRGAKQAAARITGEELKWLAIEDRASCSYPISNNKSRV